MMLMRCFCACVCVVFFFFFQIFFIKAYVVGTHLNCLNKSLVNAIQMSTHNIYFYKVDTKKDTGCNLKITEFLDCALIGVYAVISLNTVNKN